MVVVAHVAPLLLTYAAAGVNKIYLGFRRFNIRVNYLACTNRRSACPLLSCSVADVWVEVLTFNGCAQF